MSDNRILYHGSNKIIEYPEFGKGRIHNDYGQGFYCTQDLDLAREWACGESGSAFVNKYSLDLNGLNILNLSYESNQEDILRWLAVLIKNRALKLPSDVMVENAKWLVDNYDVDFSQYDVITGYRADDSYFGFARAFTGNALSFEKLSEAMKLGKLGTQIVIRSELAFKSIRFISSEPVNREVYYARRMARDLAAREEYNRMSRLSAGEGTLLVDIIRGKNKEIRSI